MHCEAISLTFTNASWRIVKESDLDVRESGHFRQSAIPLIVENSASLSHVMKNVGHSLCLGKHYI